MIKELNGISFLPLKNHYCQKCGCLSDGIYEYIPGNDSIKATCSGCGAFIKFMPHYEEPDPEPPTEKQIFYIQGFKRSNKMPMSKRRAGELITVLEKIRKDSEHELR